MNLKWIDQPLAKFIVDKKIDSVQKLHFLLYVYRHPERLGTFEEYAHWLFWADTILVEKIITDYVAVGLMRKVDHRYKLVDSVENREQLGHLATAFESPITRQEVLGLIQDRWPFRYRNKVFTTQDTTGRYRLIDHNLTADLFQQTAS